MLNRDGIGVPLGVRILTFEEDVLTLAAHCTAAGRWGQRTAEGAMFGKGGHFFFGQLEKK